MPLNYTDKEVRQSIIQDIKSQENQKRKDESVRQKEVYSDNIKPYVQEFLKPFYSDAAFKEIPLIACINLSKRIANQEASLYKEAPKRTFYGVSDEQAQALHELYEDMNFDSKMLKSNRYYRFQNQNDIYVVPVNGKLEMRVMLNHNFDVIPNADNPCEAEAYILSTYDKSLYLPRQNENQDNQNQKIADYDDYKESLKRYVFWTKDFNFITDDSGNIVSDVEQSINPLEGLLPFVDIAPDKDFQFWINQGQSLSEFTIQFNATMTDVGQVVRMQGFAQAVMTGDKDLMPANIQVGPMFVIKLPVDKNNPVTPDFKFATPNSDIAGSLQYLETLLSNYLSSRGISPKLVTGKADADKYSSGIERLLAMIDLFEASKSDIALYENAEKQLFKIIAKYINVYGGTDVLPDYNLGVIPDDAYVEVEFSRPEMIQTEMDKLNVIEKKRDLGLISQVDAIMIDRNIKDQAEAEKIAQTINSMGDING